MNSGINGLLHNSVLSYPRRIGRRTGDSIATTGQILERQLDKRGISKHTLARESGISYRTICRLVGGDKVGSLHTWIAVSKAIGCTLGELTGE